MERSIYLFIFIKWKKKKKSLQYLLKARAFMLWTLLSLGRDTVTLESWGRGEVVFLLALVFLTMMLRVGKERQK